MTPIFISYRSKQRPLATRLYNYLQSAGYSPWQDAYEIPQGKNWNRAIDEGLQKSNVMIGCVTPTALQSRNVMNEWYWALTHDIPLIFVLWETVEWMNPAFANVPVIDFRTLYAKPDDNTPYDKLPIDEEKEAELFVILQQAIEGHVNTLPVFRAEIQSFQETLEHYISSDVNESVDTAWREAVLEQGRMFIDSLEQNRILSQPILNLSFEIYDNEKVSARPEKYSYQDSAQREIADVFEHTHQRLIMTGEAGSGKTFVAMHLFEQLYEQARQDRSKPVPLLIPSTGLSYLIFSPDLVIGLSLGLVNLFKDDERIRLYIQDALRTGRIIPIIDGISESTAISVDNLILPALEDFAIQYPVVITCRTEKYKDIFLQLPLHRVEIKPISLAQIEDYVRDDVRLEPVRQVLLQNTSLNDFLRNAYWLRVIKTNYLIDTSIADKLIQQNPIDAYKQAILSHWLQLQDNKALFSHSEWLHVMRTLAQYTKRQQETNSPTLFTADMDILFEDDIANPKVRIAYKIARVFSIATPTAILSCLLLGISYALLGRLDFFIPMALPMLLISLVIGIIGSYFWVEFSSKNFKGMDNTPASEALVKPEGNNTLSQSLLGNQLLVFGSLAGADNQGARQMTNQVAPLLISILTIGSGTFFVRAFDAQDAIFTPIMGIITLVLAFIGMLPAKLKSQNLSLLRKLSDYLGFVVVFGLILGIIVAWFNTLLISLIGFLLYAPRAIWKSIQYWRKHRIYEQLGRTVLMSIVIGTWQDPLIAFFVGPTVSTGKITSYIWGDFWKTTALRWLFNRTGQFPDDIQAYLDYAIKQQILTSSYGNLYQFSSQEIVDYLVALDDDMLQNLVEDKDNN